MPYNLNKSLRKYHNIKMEETRILAQILKHTNLSENNIQKIMKMNNSTKTIKKGKK